MSKSAVLTSKAPKPIGIYSQAIANRDLVFLSAQAPLDPATGNLVDGGIEAQLVQAFTNLAAVVEAAGGTLDDIVKVTVYLTSLEHFPILNRVMETRFAPPYPARAVVGATALPAKADVAIDAIAMLQP